MRVDTARPWTWLLAGAAGWGVLAWGLALVGMGGRLPALPDGAALAKPLPTLRASTPSRIGPLGQYGEIGQRPLFSTDRRPKPFFLQGEGDANAAVAFDYVLTSVMITPRVQLAILQPPDGSQSLRVRLGDAPEPQPAWRLVSLNARSAVFEGPEGQKTLELRVFDGTGGQRPTPAADAQAVQAAVAANAAAEANERPGPQGPAVVDASPATPVPPAPRPVAPPAATNTPVTPEAQMEAIRKRIQARREQLRREAAQQAQPPAK